MRRSLLLVRITATSAVVAILGLALFGTAGAQTTPTTAPALPTIAEIASSRPEFSTLLTAVNSAGLGAAINSPGSYTVFAPTNDAFAKIPEADLQALLADPAALAKVLTYHVVPTKVLSGDLKKKQKVTTLEGSKLKILKKKKGKVTVDDAKVVEADIEGSNGVIHAIDTVLLPKDLQAG